MINGLPPNEWENFRLLDIAKLQGGKTPSKAAPRFWDKGTICWVSPKDMKSPVLLDTQDKVTDRAIQDGGLKLFPPDSILFVVRSGILKHSFPVAISNCEFTVNQDIKVIEPNSALEPRYTAYLLRAFGRQILSSCSKAGTTVNSIDIPLLEKLSLPLAPLAEQKAIADKLDTLLAQVENTKARLERIPQILKRFRQSVLAAAVSGRLTDDGEMGDESWSPTKLAILCTTAFDGPFGSKLKSSDYTNGGVGVVRLENIRHLKFDHSKETFISEDKYQTLIKNRLEKNDILFSSFVDEEVRACLFPFETLRFINKADCFCLRIDQRKALSEFVLYLLTSQISYAQIKEHVQGVTRPRVNLKILKSLEFPVPPLEKQAEVVRKVNQLFAHADRIEQQVDNALARVNNLTQSILVKAFRGELTEQWRKDNPELISGENSAEALLERIKAERAAAKPAKKTRSKRATV